MMRVRAHGDLADADGSGVANRLAQERVRLLAALLRQQIVWCLEVPRIDLVGGDEIEDLEHLRRVERGRFEVLVGHLDEASFSIFITLDDVVPGDGLAILLADALITYGGMIGAMQ